MMQVNLKASPGDLVTPVDAILHQHGLQLGRVIVRALVMGNRPLVATLVRISDHRQAGDLPKDAA